MKIKTLLLAVCATLSAALVVAQPQGSINLTADPGAGNVGDIISLRATNVRLTVFALVKIGKETAPIISDSDSAINVMVPPMAGQTTTLTVTLNGRQGQVPFIVNGSTAVRLWFSLKDSKISFLSSQPTNQDFVRDKSKSLNKLQYELQRDNGDAIATGLIDNPATLEVFSQEGISRTELKQEVRFSIVVPAAAPSGKIRLSAVNADTKFKATPITTLSVRMQ